MRHARLLAYALPVALAATSCTSPPVAWDDARGERTSDSLPVPALGSTMTETGAAATISRVSPVCESSLRIARSGRVLDAAWWSPRADSSAHLEFARSTDGGEHWTTPVPVDTTDVGLSGCRRAPPSIAADSASGYIHVAYSLVAREGPGLFFAHSMDNGSMFHSPVALVYGERLGQTSVAASGENVAIAFDDPNSRTPRIGLALSRTMGHIFEYRIMPISDANGSATVPRVSVVGQRVTVAWTEKSPLTGVSASRVRSGLLH